MLEKEEQMKADEDKQGQIRIAMIRAICLLEITLNPGFLSHPTRAFRSTCSSLGFCRESYFILNKIVYVLFRYYLIFLIYLGVHNDALYKIMALSLSPLLY